MVHILNWGGVEAAYANALTLVASREGIIVLKNLDE
jgi:hypothetical protein